MAFGAAKPFSFGAPSTSTPAATTSTAPTFSFGKPAATSTINTTGSAAPAPFSFGNSTTSTSTAAPFGGFGASTGQPAASTSGSNLFGGFGTSTANNNNNNAGVGSSLGFSFGAQNQNQQQQQQQQQQQPALNFGNISKPPLTVSQLFPSSNTGLNQSGAGSAFSLGASSSQPQLMGSSSILGQSSSNNTPANDAQILTERIMAITNAWNPSSFDNKFLFYLYNVSDVPLSTPLSSLPLPPQVAASPRLASLYKQAVLESPRPKDYLPVLASSFDDLQKRVEIQKSTSQAHLAKLKSGDVKGKIEHANKKHWNETLVRIERLSREQVKLEERLVRMCAKLAGLHPSSSSVGGSAASLSSSGAGGSGSAKDDGELLIMLEHIRNELNGFSTASHRLPNKQHAPRSNGGNTQRLANIVSELWMVVSQRKAALANNQRSGTPDNYGEYRVQDQGELNKVLEVLAQQQKSLDYLSKAIRTLCVDIDTARNGFGLPWMFNDASEGSRGMVLG